MDPPQCEYLVYASTSTVESGLVWFRLKVAYILESPEKNNSEDVHSNVEKTIAAVVLTPCLISLLDM
ncbi:unnamed protein product [Dibothriocephalus latus]|uniref:Uncharacterized protein n=1 Tax=Dibothriocephalus latus TaxID=60516 RepID=A0A3P7PEP6_DIBLA|nr:unnamed protein product [Dibothriocephalus latus]